MAIHSSPDFRNGTVLVLDIGADTCRAGFAGDTAPSIVTPSLVGGSCGSTAAPFISHTLAGTAGVRPCFGYDDTGWPQSCADDLEQLLQRTVRHTCGTTRSPGPAEAAPPPLLLAEPTFSSSKLREALATVAFECLGVPSIAYAPTAALSAFAFGRASALVVDVGAGLTTVVPVHNGCPSHDASLRAAYGGQKLDAALLNALRAQGANLAPDGDSTQQGAALRLAQGLKETICFCSHLQLADLPAVAAYHHTLPDGKTVDVTAFSRSIPETLLIGDGVGFPGVPALMMKSCAAYEPIKQGARDPTLNNVLIVGGSSLFVNFKARVDAEMQKVPTTSGLRRSKVLAASKEQRHAAWLGGSAVGSATDTKACRWFTREEYLEKGAAAVNMAQM